jgi:hypothetical protein
MLTTSVPLIANQPVKFSDKGDFYRVLAATAPLTTRVYQKGRVLSEATAINAGYAEDFQDPFDELEIVSSVNQTVQIAIRLGSVIQYDQAPVGNVQVTNTPTVTVGNVNSAANQNRASVTNANQQLLAANPARRYLIIQNNDASAVLRVTLNSVAATLTAGFRVSAGGVLEVPFWGITGAINVMMETATVAVSNVEFLEA